MHRGHSATVGPLLGSPELRAPGVSRSPRPRSNGSQELEAALPTVRGAVAQTARRYFLSQDERNELLSYVCLKLLEDDARKLRSFRGESSFRTYLVVVVKRLYFDLRTQARGKWRSSAAAKQGGDLFERVEKLIYRDGYSPDQTLEYLRTTLSVSITDAAFQDILSQLRPRIPPILEGGDALDTVVDDRFRPDVSMQAAETAAREARVGEAWQAFRATLAGEDRLIAALHFDDEAKPARIALALKCDVQHVYARLDRIKELARRHMTKAGIAPANLMSA